MKNRNTSIIIVVIIFSSCATRNYRPVEVENSTYIPNTVFQSSEDLSSPKFSHLISKYRLDTVFKGETDEFKRVLLLRHWIKSIIQIDDFGDPYPGDGFTEGILDAALQGHGFHCGHFMTVQNGIMNAFGYVTRTLGAGPGVEGGPDGHHGINEIWLNDHKKWFLSDAKYDHHFEKEGFPLSALEIRDEYLKNKGADLALLKGPDRMPIDVDEENGISKERYAQTYTWIEWHLYNDMFTNWPDHSSVMLMYEDDYFRSHTWIWDGKPHWAYNTEYLVTEIDRNAIEWTPNMTRSTVKVEDGKALIVLNSTMPNIKEFQMKHNDELTWTNTGDTLEFKLKGKELKLIFRAVNLADVAGPEHILNIMAD